MIDALITWVDGNENKHRQKRKNYKPNEPGVEEGGIKPTRFNTKFELYYCLMLIRKNAQWIDRIFLITDEQIPGFIKNKEIIDNRLVIIDHKQIFTGYDKYLPTFNSQTIETVLHRIPGISNNIVYLNDDFFIINPIRESDYFNGGKLLVRGRTKHIGFLGLAQRGINKLIRLLSLKKEKIGYVGFRAEKNLITGRLFQLAHAPYPIFAGTMREVVDRYQLLPGNIKYRFRNINQLRPITFVINYCLKNGLAKKGPEDWGYISAVLTEEEILKRLEHYAKSKKYKSLCIQDLDTYSPQLQESIKQFLEDRLKA